MMVTYIKQHLSNIWSSFHEKVKQHWRWVEKKRYLEKKHVFIVFLYFSKENKDIGEKTFSEGFFIKLSI